MAKLTGVPAGREVFRNPPDLQSFKFEEAQINKGMITMLDPADIPPGAMQLVKNATVRFDRTSRRPGSVLLLPVKPDGSPILKLASIKKKDGTTYTLRFTPSALHNRGGVNWQLMAGVLNGSVKDRIQTAVVQDELIFTNNGADPIQLVDFTGNSYGPLGNAPNYRYITGLFNRAVGAALRDTNEVQVGWSGDGNVTEWDAAVDETAGDSPILESPADLSDFITGIFSWTNVGVLLRERSLWTIQKQAIPQNPFFFTTAVPGIGCDSPFSAQITGTSIAWLDRRTGTVYSWSPGSQPNPIGRPIERSILANVDDPQTIFSSYDPINNEYSICIPQTGSKYVNVWTYNQRNQTWAKNEYYALTSTDDVDLATAGLTIDQLGDVAIDDLTGTIDSLSPTSEVISTRVYGRDDGTIGQADVNEDTDAAHTDFPAGIPYSTQVVSKAYQIPEDDIYVAEIRIEYESSRGGTFTLEYSKNGGATEESWRLAKTVNPRILGEPRLLIFRRFIKCRKFAWRLTTNEGLFDTLSYEIHVYPSGKSTK
jgi:hypothetical protein